MVKIILRDGSETTLGTWQGMYGLEVGSDKIGNYFSIKEQKFAQNLREHGYLVVNELLIRVMDLAREKDKKSWTINAFNRSDKDQVRLQNDPNYAAAKYSPHVVNMAADIGCSVFDIENKKNVLNPIRSKLEVFNKVELLQEAAKELGIKVRVGYREYLLLKNPMYFVHVDVCPEFFVKGKPFHSRPHPVQWENVVTW
jgi:hypothetical protein